MGIYTFRIACNYGTTTMLLVYTINTIRVVEVQIFMQISRQLFHAHIPDYNEHFT